MAQTIPILITVSLVVPRLSLYSSQSAWWYLDYPYTNHSLTGGTQTIPILITVSLVDTQTILVFITAALVVLGLSLYSSQSLWWSSVYPYPHHFLFDGTLSIPIQSLITVYILAKTIPMLITVYLVAQTIHILITVSLVVPRLSLYSSQSAWWYPDYPYTHHSLPGGTQTIPIPITVSLVILRLFLFLSQPPWRHSGYPYTNHSLPGGTQNIPINITVSLMVLRLSL